VVSTAWRNGKDYSIIEFDLRPAFAATAQHRFILQRRFPLLKQKLSKSLQKD